MGRAPGGEAGDPHEGGGLARGKKGRLRGSKGGGQDEAAGPGRAPEAGREPGAPGGGEGGRDATRGRHGEEHEGQAKPRGESRGGPRAGTEAAEGGGAGNQAGRARRGHEDKETGRAGRRAARGHHGADEGDRAAGEGRARASPPGARRDGKQGRDSPRESREGQTRGQIGATGTANGHAKAGADNGGDNRGDEGRRGEGARAGEANPGAREDGTGARGSSRGRTRRTGHPGGQERTARGTSTRESNHDAPPNPGDRAHPRHGREKPGTLQPHYTTKWRLCQAPKAKAGTKSGARRGRLQEAGRRRRHTIREVRGTPRQSNLGQDKVEENLSGGKTGVRGVPGFGRGASSRSRFLVIVFFTVTVPGRPAHRVPTGVAGSLDHGYGVSWSSLLTTRLLSFRVVSVSWDPELTGASDRERADEARPHTTPGRGGEANSGLERRWLLGK